MYAMYENPSSSHSQVIVLTRGITLPYKGRPKKKIHVRLSFVLMLYIKFQVPSSSGSLVLQPTKGVKDRQMDGQTDRQTGPNQYAPSTSS